MSTITRLEFKNGAKKENKYIMTCILDMRYTLEETNHSRKKKNGANFVIMEHMEQI